MSLDVAALIGAGTGVLSPSAPFGGSAAPQGPEYEARLGRSEAPVREGGSTASVSDLSDSGGEDELLREVCMTWPPSLLPAHGCLYQQNVYTYPLGNWKGTIHVYDGRIPGSGGYYM